MNQTVIDYDPSLDTDITFNTLEVENLQIGADGIPLPPVELSIRIGSPDLNSYMTIGAQVKEHILRSLPADWEFKGKRVLDFGCGIGRVLRHFAPEASQAEIWGYDIDMRSVMWLNKYLCPPFHIFQNSENAYLPLESDSFDLVFAISVFSHLSHSWNQWLAELRRVLRPGGYAFISFMHRRPYEAIYGVPFPTTDIGMLVKHPNQPWDKGGPFVFISPNWLLDNWGALFDIEFLALDGLIGYQSIALMRKPSKFTTPKDKPSIVVQAGTQYAINPNARAHIHQPWLPGRRLIDNYGIRGSKQVQVSGWGAFAHDSVARLEFIVNERVLALVESPSLKQEGKISDLGDAPYCKFDETLDVSVLSPGSYELMIRFYSSKNEVHWARTPLIVEP